MTLRSDNDLQLNKGRSLAYPHRLWLALLLAITTVLITVPAAVASQPGETLNAIAATIYGTTVESLATANSLRTPDLIAAEQQLTIPETHNEAGESEPVSGTIPITHIVREGETLGTIARRYGVTTEELVRWNQIPDANTIHIGQEFQLYLDADISTLDTLPAGPFEGVEISPSPATQGQTVAIIVTTTRPVTITATFDGREIPFVNEGGRQWALLGIHAMTQPGFYSIDLYASETITANFTATDSVSETSRVTLGLYVFGGDFETYNIVFDPSSGKSKLLDSKLIQSEWEHVSSIYAQRPKTQRWDGPFGYPLEAKFRRITSPFGERRSYNGGPATSYHAGVDYGAAEGTPISAPAGGVIALAEELSIRGNAVIIDHGYGIYTGFWHLSELDVAEGEPIKAGDLVGKVGTTGLSTGDHLHWEMRVGGIAVDALQWVDGELLPFSSVARTSHSELKTIQDALPLTIGASWTYSVTLDYGEEDGSIHWSNLITETIAAGVQRENAQVLLVLETGRHPLHTLSQDRRYRYIIMGDRVYQLAGNEFTTPLIQAGGEGHENALRYVWPIYVGDRWGDPERIANETQGYTWEVVDEVTVQTLAGQFTHCYHLAYHANTGYTEVWFCPGIGVVRKEIHHNGSQLDEVWDLTTYHLPD